jgi:hypothetical protein
MQTLHDADDVRRLLTQASERLNPGAQLSETDPNTWVIEFHSGGSFELEWCADGSRLVLTAALGVPPAEGEIAALNLALSYNALWRDIGDLRIARDGDDGEMLLIGELGPEDGEPETFLEALQRFESLQRWWSEAIAQSDGEQGGDAAPVDQALLLGRT